MQINPDVEDGSGGVDHGDNTVETGVRDTDVEQKSGLRLPTSTIPDRKWFHGAYVFPPKAGRHENVIYPDHSAMYPNMIRNLNISPETLIGPQSALDDSEYSEDDCVWGYIDTRDVKRCENHERWQQYKDTDRYKAVFQKSSKGDWKKRWHDDPQFERCYYLHPDVKTGFMNDVVDDMLGLKEKYKGTDKYLSTKQIVNSTWGYLGYATEYNASRLFNWMMAETITLTGRKLIQHTAESISNHIEDQHDTTTTVVAGDTDSAVISIPDVGLKSTAIEHAQNAADWYNTEAADEFMKTQCNVDSHYVDLEIESYAPVAYFHDSKKRYFQRITWEEGDEIDEKEVKGFELVRSDVSDLTQEVQGYVADQILYEDRGTAKANIYEYLRDTKESVENGDIPLEKVGKRKGISKPLGEYGTASRSPTSVIRGAKYARDNIEGEENIGIGSKPMGFPITTITTRELPRVYEAATGEDGDLVDYVAVEDVDNVRQHFEVDWDEVLDTQVKRPVEDILENMGWSWSEMEHQHSQESIASFM